jgi:hypothetical protein
MRQVAPALLLLLALAACGTDTASTPPDAGDARPTDRHSFDSRSADLPLDAPLPTDLADLPSPDLVDLLSPDLPPDGLPDLETDGELDALGTDGELDATLDSAPDLADDLEADAAVPFPFGEPCDDDGACAGGTCLETPLGGLCTSGCDDGCPAGWQCWEIGEGSLCVPPTLSYCDACNPAVPPPFPELTCLELDGDLVLLLACADDGTCPGDLACEELPSGDRCVPPSGSCQCLPADADTDLLCPIANEWGTCYGWALCLGVDGLGECVGKVPAQEVCNGEDDDCDGIVDESWPQCKPQFCLQQGVAFLVEGPEICVDGSCQPSGQQKDCGQYACDQVGALGDCLESCEGNDDCVVYAYCDPDGACTPRKPDGGLCKADDECLSGHCNHSICCMLGNCCFEASYCPGAYALDPVCDDPEVCQGHRRDAACNNFMCQLGPIVPDDSGCTAETLSNDCGAYPEVYCNGLPKQVPPGCAAGCDEDSDCAPGNHCDAICTADVADGLSCDEDSDCASGHCTNGLCCDAGTCCDNDATCQAAFAVAPTCSDPTACQGFRVDATCVDFACVVTEELDDDSGCTGETIALPCDHFADRLCNGDSTQAPPTCPKSCTSEAQCDPGYACKAGACIAKGDPGKPCGADAECLTGHCANGFCCATGHCCQKAGDCPAEYAAPPSCQDEESCQGSRLDATCIDNVCGTVGPIDDDSGCSFEVLAQACAPYPDLYCTGKASQLPPACAKTCQQDDDCGQGAHCDLVCTTDLPDGYSCDEDSDCISGHCNGEVCCAGGSCCLEAADCPPDFSLPPTCETAAQCQGYRVDAQCVDFQCTSSPLVGDDSGCDGQTPALECPPYQPVHCKGTPYQVMPVCPAFCTADEGCLEGYHCDQTCQPDRADGMSCDESSDCLSGHCANGFCCAEGDCCSKAADCPASWSAKASCDQPGTCQGHRIDATCIQATCGSVTVQDDSGCGPQAVVDDCGPYLPVTCDGTADQAPAPCPEGCLLDAECDVDAHCDAICLADQAAGTACDEDSDCTSGHCANGFCCASGDCCATAADCPEGYSGAPVCQSHPLCQGARVDAVCNAFQCASETVEDDSACDPTILADNCGPNPDLYCSGEPAQTPPVCSPACEAEEECGQGYHCDTTCKPDVANGLSCDEDSDCASGHCANGFCCASGDCCQFNYHCPAEYAVPAVCASPAGCQGHRFDRACSQFTCLSQKIPDDSACTAEAPALDCDPYLDRFCNGQPFQAPPACPTACTADPQCQPGYHCDGQCLPDRGDGESCDEHSDCTSGHCANGFCCADGVCCSEAADCPGTFSAAAACDAPASCQGTRVDPVCQDSVCGSLTVDDDSGCTAQTLSQACGHFSDRFCNGAFEQVQPACPDQCAGDGECDGAAHCDGVCVADQPAGGGCDEDSDCASGHCSNGLCCAQGECCNTAADCPANFAKAASCTQPSTCQGQRIDALCTNHVCASLPVEDDSACTPAVEALPCGAYVAKHCTGDADQAAPSCPTACADDTACDPGAHCDSVCLGDLADGANCNEDSDCASGHCSAGLCCAQGDCCLVAAACPAKYKAFPKCETTASCQGKRVDATCIDFVCGSIDKDDDSGCGWWVTADDCGPYKAVACNGSKDQAPPECPVGCTMDNDCDPAAHCDGTCQLDLPAGAACDEETDCASGHCANGFCCEAGDCCNQAADCPALYAGAATCKTTSTCQGSRLDPICAEHVCDSLEVDDDTACTPATEALPCGLYAPVHCTGLPNQQPPACPASCTENEGCDPGAHCDQTCQPDRPDGTSCDESSDCLSDHCANGFCCAEGDCCFDPAHCPAPYWADPVCDSAPSCQGHRVNAACTDSMCATADVPDDSGCTPATEVSDCGPYKSIFCNGKTDQLAPQCPTLCSFDSQCDPGHSCIGNQCSL